MIKSMTGFGSKEAKIAPFGKISVEIRSTNHKFLETVLHVPEGFLSLEDRIKKEIEARVTRGRITCAINIVGGEESGVFINKGLLTKYLLALKTIKDEFQIKDHIRIDTLVHLPGVLSLAESVIPKERIWPGLKNLVEQAADGMAQMRQKEGRALCVHLKKRAHSLKTKLAGVKATFLMVVKEKAARFDTDEERSSFLKDSDITEEIERLAFHIGNMSSKLSGAGPIGKELDFIAQEMQRETNTMGAKSCDASISAAVVEIKSQIEKIREQVQNIE